MEGTQGFFNPGEALTELVENWNGIKYGGVKLEEFYNQERKVRDY